MCKPVDKLRLVRWKNLDGGYREISAVNLKQGHREFPFWKRKFPPAKEKIPENSRSVKCLILHALTQ